MYGRNGADHFSRFLSYAGIIIYLIGSFVPVDFLSTLLTYLGLFMMIFSIFRMFSKNVNKRRAENARYFEARQKFTSSFRNWNERRKMSRDYCFFRCPACKSMLRVPRGKGKIRVTCRKCGNAFEKRT